MTPNQKSTVIITLVVALSVVGGTLVVGWEWFVDNWYLTQFATGDAETRRAAGEKLVARRAIIAMPRFLGHYVEQQRAPDEDFASPILADLSATEMAALGRELNASDPNGFLVCAELYAAIEEPRSPLVPVLLAALRSGKPGLRRWGAEELSRIGPEAVEAEPELRALQDDPDELVRMWADIALRAIRVGSE